MLSGLKHLSLWPWPAQQDTSTSSGVGAAERRRWSSSVSVSHTTPHRVASRRHFRFISGPLDSRSSPQYYSHANWCLDLCVESNKDRDTTTVQKNTRLHLYTNCNDMTIIYLLYIAIYDQIFTLKYSYPIRMCLYCFIDIVRLATILETVT